LENVVGFESAWEDKSAAAVDINTSETAGSNNKPSTQNASSSRGSFAEWRAVLSQRQYETAHFHLDPTHVGLPNNRPRYYCIAFRRGRLLQQLMKASFTDQRPLLNLKILDKLFSREDVSKEPIIHNELSIENMNGKEAETGSDMKQDIPPIKYFLDADLALHDTHTNEQSTKMKSLQIPEKVRTSSSAWCFDIATPYHTCSSCFTHSYGKYIRGTGSILYTGTLRLNNEADEQDPDKSIPSIDRFRLALPEERSYDESWSNDINWEYMRYLSGTEIARLMGFPVSEPAAEVNQSTPSEDDVEIREFSFPSTCTMKQQWKLLGNSLNVRVAATIAEIGIQAMLRDLAKTSS
jgi:tRNA (cytosine38-C5)-methyltransferase